MKKFYFSVTAKYGMIIFAWILVVSFLLAMAVKQASADELYTRIVTEKITYMIANDYDRASPVSPHDLAKWEIEIAAFEETAPNVMQVVVRNPDPAGSPVYPRLIVRVMWHEEFGLVGLVLAYDYVKDDVQYRYRLNAGRRLFERVKPVEPGDHPHPELKRFPKENAQTKDCLLCKQLSLPEVEGEIRRDTARRAPTGGGSWTF